MNRILKTAGVILLIIVATPIIFFLIIQAWFYATCPIYTFREPHPFSADSFYNPYDSIANGSWKKAIFHLHTKRWGGITNGEDNWEEVTNTYKKLGFDVVSISNYMKIDSKNKQNENYIPCYEHGYSYGKTHLTPMGGSKKVLWRDYALGHHQNIHQKQHIINLLKSRCQLLALNHPDLRYGYTPADFKYLSNYDLMETLNGAVTSSVHWDSALSNGHAVWLAANDDAHTVANLSKVQRDVIYINAPSNSSKDILENLARGAAFGVHFPTMQQATLIQKQEIAKQVTFPEYIQLANDTLFIAWKQPMSSISFIGDNGILRAQITDTNRACYAIQPADTYIRIKMEDPHGLIYYLNPIVRSADGKMPPKQNLATIDRVKTIGKRTLISSVLILLGIALFYKRLRKKIVIERRYK